jgi:hypothetical protein
MAQFGTSRGVLERAHRVAWRLTGKPLIPDGAVLMHACDNRLCVNPAHLSIGTQRDNVRDAVEKGRARGQFAPVDPAIVPAIAPIVPSAPRILDIKKSPASDGGLPKAQQAILDAIAFYASIGNPQPAKQAVGGLAGINPRLSTWRGHMAPLRAADLVRDVGSDRLELTAAGRKMARRVAIPSLRELQERWLSEVPATAAAILRALIAVYPSTLTKHQVGERVGVDPALSTWRGYMSPLRKLGLVEDVNRSELKASALLFPGGLK